MNNESTDNKNEDQTNQINSSAVNKDVDMKSDNQIGSSLVDADMSGINNQNQEISKKDSNSDAPIEIKQK